MIQRDGMAVEGLQRIQTLVSVLWPLNSKKNILDEFFKRINKAIKQVKNWLNVKLCSTITHNTKLF